MLCQNYIYTLTFINQFRCKNSIFYVHRKDKTLTALTLMCYMYQLLTQKCSCLHSRYATAIEEDDCSEITDPKSDHRFVSLAVAKWLCTVLLVSNNDRFYVYSH